MKNHLSFEKEKEKSAISIVCPHCQIPLHVEVYIESAGEKKAAAPAPSMILAGSKSDIPLDPQKVVIAIDGEGTREFIKDLLEESQFDVTDVSSFEDLFPVLERITPATILIDLGLPNITRTPVGEAIQKMVSGKGSTLILISAGYGKHNPYSAVHAPLLGADDYIERRHIHRDLIQKINRHLEKSRSVIVTEAPSVPVLDKPTPATTLEEVLVETIEPEAPVTKPEGEWVPSLGVTTPSEVEAEPYTETVAPETVIPESSVEAETSIEPAMESVPYETETIESTTVMTESPEVEAAVETIEPQAAVTESAIEIFPSEPVEAEPLSETIEPTTVMTESPVEAEAPVETIEPEAPVTESVIETFPSESVEAEPLSETIEPTTVMTESPVEAEASVETIEPEAALSDLEAEAWGSTKTVEQGTEVEDSKITLVEPEKTLPDVETAGTTRLEEIVDLKELEAAKRLARIIVSDIVLYNESKVSDGIQNNTFYTLLQDEIEEGRNHYNSRVSETILKQGDYLTNAFEDFIKKRKAAIQKV